MSNTEAFFKLKARYVFGPGMVRGGAGGKFYTRGPTFETSCLFFVFVFNLFVCLFVLFVCWVRVRVRVRVLITRMEVGDKR